MFFVLINPKINYFKQKKVKNLIKDMKNKKSIKEKNSLNILCRVLQ